MLGAMRSETGLLPLFNIVLQNISSGGYHLDLYIFSSTVLLFTFHLQLTAK